MRNTFPKILMLAAMMILPTAFTWAQDTKPAEAVPDVQPAPNQPDGRGNMLRLLGLSTEQIQQIRRINQERKPLMEEAQHRFREANRGLDAAIYADEVNDAEIQARLKDVQTAQAEIQRLRYMNELAVRRILTPEQLVHFREMRERFEKARQNADGQPFRNMRRMERQFPPNETHPVSPPTRVVKREQPKPNQ